MLSFDLKELHRMFRKFYLELDADENLTFEYDEMVTSFETFSKEELLGIKNIKKILKSIGVDFQAGIMQLFQEGTYEG
jgi:hypothetical protein